MITISDRANKKEIEDFNKQVWHDMDIEHYGRTVEWKEKKFVFKAMEDGVIVGAINGKHESGVIYIGDIIVAKDKRGLGIGKSLMQKAEELGISMGAHKVWLVTGKDWQAAKFYEALGYKKTGILKKHHFKKDFVIFEKFI